MAPSNGLEAAADYVRAYVAIHNPAVAADLPKLTQLLNSASYVVRSRISTYGNWAFARFREVLTAAIQPAAAEQIPTVLLPNKCVGELVVVQLTPTAAKGEVTYLDPTHFERLTAEDSAVATNSRTDFYTIYNGRELHFYKPAVAGNTYRIAGRLDLMDTGNVLPMNFAAFVSCIYLFFVGAAPPKDRKSWMDEAADALGELQSIDRPAERGVDVLQLPEEEARHLFNNS